MPENPEKPPLHELRQIWARAWGREPPARIGRTMLEKSLEYKVHEQEGHGLTMEQSVRLSQLIKQYTRNPQCFDGSHALTPGTRLVRMHAGKKHSVLVKAEGFEYQGIVYGSLSKIAHQITGTHWNGKLFFGLKKSGAA